ncbi:long-chain-fatty-acid--CoA ligase [Yinghuangia soli]|uniref:Long-chain-fatty-acid--CoA ligase n=1 Tax=Yinghuangia soli TaxID=2908204 RepID=A0AA41Q9C2_9ACTN|nr:long-chain-fatty-acid--CoA ligase [Yinghuangia soli]MCF2532734.1 long-chain-fatty-acid--CoA ligase [Yinghuangia soli]
MASRWSVTMNELVRRRAGDPGTAVRVSGRSWTWDEHVRLSAQRAAFLEAERAEGKPFHIGVMLENVPEFSFLLGAAAVSGAVIVGLNPTRQGSELARDVEHTDCTMVITGDAHAAQLREALPDFPADRVWNVDDESWAAALAPHEGAELPDTAPAPDDPFMLILTSGTTGHPKAVICSQGKIASQGGAIVMMQQLTADDVVYCAMPLFHSNAMVTCWSPALSAGSALVLRRRFSASGFLPDVREYGVTYANYVGKPLSYILATPEQPDDADNTLTRVFGNEGGPQDVERFARRFGCSVRDGFGSTEGGLSFTPVPGMPPGALGKASGDIRVLDPETREECPPGRFDASGRLLNADEAVGELVNLDGAGTFEGYWNNAAATADRLREGWYWSGDLAYRDGDGMFFFAGRSGEWVRVGGENFGSAPVARILARHPDVVLASVYGVPDEAAGDQAMAALVLREGAEFDPAEFAAWQEAQPDLSPTWRPRYVRVADELPHTQTNKVLVRVLSRQAWYSGGGQAGAVWWRPGKDGAYEPFGDAEVKALETRFAEHGRAHVLDLLERPTA